MSYIIYVENDQPKKVAAVPGAEGFVVRVRPGVGQPFWVFATLPSQNPITSADMTGAPVATSNAATNQAAIAAITATPEQKLTFAE